MKDFNLVLAMKLNFFSLPQVLMDMFYQDISYIEDEGMLTFQSDLIKYPHLLLH